MKIGGRGREGNDFQTITMELFDIPESLSPRLVWLRSSGILTHHSPRMEYPWIAIKPFERDKGKDIGTIFAESCRIYDESHSIGYGNTEDEAITSLAHKLNLTLWQGA